jgi:hypothetical protein
MRHDHSRRKTVVIRGTTTLIAHLGYPTEAFKAPMIYNPYFEQAGIDAIVVPMGIKAEDYPGVLASLFKLTNIHAISMGERGVTSLRSSASHASMNPMRVGSPARGMQPD